MPKYIITKFLSKFPYVREDSLRPSQALICFLDKFTL